MIWLFHRYYPARKLIFFVVETLLIIITIFLAFYLHNHYIPAYVFSLDFLFKIVFLVLFLQLWLYYFNLYSFRNDDNLIEIFFRLLEAIGIATFLIGIIYFIFPSLMISSWSFMVFLFLIIFLAVSWRLVYFFFLKKGFFNEKVAILGFGDLAKEIFFEINNQIDCGFWVNLFIISSDDQNNKKELDRIRSLSRHPFDIHTSFEKIYDVCFEKGIDKIVVCLDERRGGLPVDELLYCRMQGLDIVEGETFYEHLTGKIIVEKIRPSWLIFHQGFRKSWHTLFFKRVLGILLASVGLILTLPLTVLVALAIKLDSKGPILFVQERVGKDGKVFRLYKFRSMKVDAEKDRPRWATKNDPRVTRVGRVIRKLRIDEIPQMWNVLKGDMAFVGPRPERPVFVQQLRQKIPFYDQRHTVQPGITGWAQICYPYGASEKDALEKLKYDLYYIKYMSTMFDFYIIFKTVKIVLFGEGAR